MSSKNSFRNENAVNFLDRSHDVNFLSSKNKVGGTDYKKQKIDQIDDDYFNSASSKVLLNRKTSDSAKFIQSDTNKTVINLHNNYTDDIYSIDRGNITKIGSKKVKNQILP